MKPNEYTYIEELIERFFEGDTSNAEEQKLYEFFARPDLPEHLEPYRKIFCYFESGIAAETAEPEAPRPVRKNAFAKRWLFITVTVAASFLLLFVLNNRREAAEEFNPYAGSYIIRNGVRTEIPEDMARNLDKLIMQSEKDRRKQERLAFHSGNEHTVNTEKYRQKEREMKQVEERVNRIEEDFFNTLKLIK